MKKEITVLPDHTDIAAVYGLLGVEARRSVRLRCVAEYDIPQTTFYWYLRTNKIPDEKRKGMIKIINQLLIKKGFRYAA